MSPLKEAVLVYYQSGGDLSHLKKIEIAMRLRTGIIAIEDLSSDGSIIWGVTSNGYYMTSAFRDFAWVGGLDGAWTPPPPLPRCIGRT